MKRTLICTLALVFLVPAAWAENNGWPNELASVQRMVKSKFGDVPFHRVEVRREGNATEVSIKLKNMPRQFRSAARAQAGDDDLFLATNFVELFAPEFNSFGFDVFPLTNRFSYNYGFVAFNFGEKIKRRAEITVADADSVEIHNIKKRLKIKKNRVIIRWVEDTIDEDGLHFLYTELGPHNLTNFFCPGCG